MKNIIYQVDAFSESVFTGNPAGVMLLEKNLPSEKMQKIANEMNLSETAFVKTSSKPFQIRFFTPTVEIPLCGHATLASAHILFENEIVKKNETIDFNSNEGVISVSYDEKGIKMILPKFDFKKARHIDKFESIVGFSPTETYSTKNNWIIAIAKNEQEIIDASPSFNEMIQNGIGHLIITSLSNQENIDIVLRCFAPASGIDEDPVTGSAQCGLIPVWNSKTGITKFEVEQVSKRTGKLSVKLIDEGVVRV